MEKKKVSKEKVQPWLDALRSGEYTQCKARLKSGDSYCCIGVWGVVHNLKISESGDTGGSTIEDCPYKNIGYTFSCDDQIFWSLNDVQGKSFKEIANFVEENYELV
jgi:hypothetical protein